MKKPPQEIAIAESIAIPMIDGKESCDAALRAIAEMERVAKDLRKKICCDEVARFFEARPKQDPILLGWSQSWASARWATAHISSKHHTTEDCRKLALILNPWVGEWKALPELDASNGFQEVGRWLLGDGPFEAWVAQRERLGLENSVARSDVHAKGPRV